MREWKKKDKFKDFLFMLYKFKIICVNHLSDFYILLSSEMDNIKAAPFRGIVNDFKGRKACYKQDWIATLYSGAR